MLNLFQHLNKHKKNLKQVYVDAVDHVMLNSFQHLS